MVGLDGCCENFNDSRDELEFVGKNKAFSNAAFVQTLGIIIIEVLSWFGLFL